MTTKKEAAFREFNNEYYNPHNDITESIISCTITSWPLHMCIYKCQGGTHAAGICEHHHARAVILRRTPAWLLVAALGVTELRNGFTWLRGKPHQAYQASRWQAPATTFPNPSKRARTHQAKGAGWGCPSSQPRQKTTKRTLVQFRTFWDSNAKKSQANMLFNFGNMLIPKKIILFVGPKKKNRKWKKIWTKVWSQGNCGPNRRLFSNSKIEAEERWKNATAEISPKPDVFVLPPTCYFSDHVEFLPREPILYPARNFGRHRHYFDPRLLFRWCKMPPRVNICVRNAGLNITLIFPNPNLNPNGEKKGIVVL